MKILLWLLLCLTLVSSEDEGPIIDIDYALNPRQLWTATASEVGENNGAFISPDGSLVVVTSSDATIRGYDAETGASLFTTQPNSLGFPVNNYGGVTFSPSRDFFVFAVVDGAPNPELTTLGARSRIFGMDYSGSVIFQSAQITGMVADTPVMDSDGTHVVVTHNVDGLRGLLSVFYIPANVPGQALPPLITQDYIPVTGLNETGAQRPFSPVGFYHNPIAGWYDGGVTNTNDMFVWAWDTERTAESISEGQMFVLQFPTNYVPGDGSALSLQTMGGQTDWHASTPPTLSSRGIDMHWSATGSKFNCWIGQEGLARSYFSRIRAGQFSTTRGQRPFSPRMSSRTQPTVGSDRVFGAGANTQIWSNSLAFDDTQTQETNDLVAADLILSLDETRVIYATMESLTNDGEVVMVRANNLQQIWTIAVPFGVLGELALSPDGTRLYFANAIGEISAYEIAENNSPTSSPTILAVPTVSPVIAASEMPSAAASETPSLAPSIDTTPGPTGTNSSAPSLSGTAPPVAAPGVNTSVPSLKDGDTEMPAVAPVDSESGATNDTAPVDAPVDTEAPEETEAPAAVPVDATDAPVAAEPATEAPIADPILPETAAPTPLPVAPATSGAADLMGSLLWLLM